MTRLATLLPEAACPSGLGCIEVCGLAADSRKVAPGFVFFALAGTKADGASFIADAIEKGAVAIVADRQPHDTLPGIAFILVDDARHALARAAAAWHARQPETIAAITGTSGKTSIAAFCRQIWEKLGHRAASMGTIGIVAPGGSAYGTLTTPDPIALHEGLDQLAGDDVTHLALEASSHGIEQRRLDGVWLAAAAFTNLSRDHLDYHGSLDAYLAAKLRLFDTLLPADKPAVINADSDMADKVIGACKKRGIEVLDVGRNARRLRLVGVSPEDLGAALTLEVDGRRIAARLPLAGEFQVSNALVAAGVCIATGDPVEGVLDALATLEGAPGRLQLVGRRGAAPVFVDYAHKPDALEKVLATLRPLTAHTLTVVLGCGGDRDQGKRPIMGEIAARLADHVIVTDDNPRSEEPAVIRRAILEGAKSAGTNGGHARVFEIGDRATAIEEAVASLMDGDVLVIAGKGHETGQIVGPKVLPFSDLDCALGALQKHPR